MKPSIQDFISYTIAILDKEDTNAFSGIIAWLKEEMNAKKANK